MDFKKFTVISKDPSIVIEETKERNKLSIVSETETRKKGDKKKKDNRVL